jgi:REP element-mobilizing transposase RayT
MSYHPRIESSEYASFLTTRSRNSELWFVNNRQLEEAILGYAAKYAERYEVKLYALAIEGNHIQKPAHFPKENRADFMRDFNSSVARAVSRYVPEYPGGTFWGRRYSQEFLPAEDIEKQFFYTVLQPVQDGLVERISDYPGYNCFRDAVHGTVRKFKVMDWAAYNSARRFNSRLRKQDFMREVSLQYERLPGYEALSQGEYAKLMKEKLEEHRLRIVKERLSKGLGFAGRKALLKTKRGARPRFTKVSTISSHRPRVLSNCPARRAECLKWYFDNYYAYHDASLRYRSGETEVEFPTGMYPPRLPRGIPKVAASGPGE